MEKALAIISLIGIIIALFSLGTLSYAVYAFWNHEIMTSLFCMFWGGIGITFYNLFFNH